MNASATAPCAFGARRHLLCAVLLLAALPIAPAPARAQESLSPLPPPVTRSLYRSQWFEYLSAFTENDAAGEKRALDGMVRAARKVGVHHLSDFSRTAVFLGRRAQRLGQTDRASRAYEAALELDPANPDAVAARLTDLLRQGRIGEAARTLPLAALAILATREARVAALSSLGLWIALALAAALVGLVVGLAVRHFARAAHDVRETARRAFGPGAALPLAIAIAGLPLFVGFGPLWLVLWWVVLLFPYTDKRERAVLAGALVGVALVPVLLGAVTGENIRQRSPLLTAAVDLAERREDASAEDGLRQASAVFPEDSDVWYLLGIFAERAGDMRRAQEEYGRAIQADPADYRPIMNRGNVHFTEGDYGEAIRDYIEASKRAPGAAEIYYNLALARGEAYDFDGQAAAMRQAREASNSQVNGWMANPTLSRVVPAGYSLARARARIAEWNAQPKSRRLPGHGTAAAWRELLSVWSLLPLAALAIGLLYARYRERRGLAAECDRCGRAFCMRCRRYGDPALYCSACARSHLHKQDVDIEEQVAETRAMQRRSTWRQRARRAASILLPGSGAVVGERPVAGYGTLLLFFLAVAAAVIDHRLFDPLALPPESWLRATTLGGAALSLLVWIRAQFTARRAPRGA